MLYKNDAGHCAIGERWPPEKKEGISQGAGGHLPHSKRSPLAHRSVTSLLCCVDDFLQLDWYRIENGH